MKKASLFKSFVSSLAVVSFTGVSMAQEVAPPEGDTPPAEVVQSPPTKAAIPPVAEKPQPAKVETPQAEDAVAEAPMRRVPLPPQLAPATLPATPGVSALGSDSKTGQAVASLLLDGKVAEASSVLKTGAEKGEADSLFLLGWMAQSGKGQAKQQPNFVAAEKNYRAGHKAGHLPSSLSLGAMLLRSGDAKKMSEGAGVLKVLVEGDAKEAGFWYALSCAMGANSAPDFASAIELWERSAEAGNITSYYHLGLAYSGAYGFPARLDLKRAAQVWQKGADAGDPNCALRLAYLLMGAVPPSGITTDQATKYLKQASGARLAEATYMLAEVTRFGEFGIEKADPAAASALFHLAAEANHVGAIVRLAEMLELGGENVQIDLPGALSLIQKAASLGVPIALYRLGEIAREGSHGMEADKGLASRAFLSAALAGHAPSAAEVGMAYRAGKLGMPADLMASKMWLETAAKAGSAVAYTKLAEMMLRGELTGANLETVQTYLFKGAEGKVAKAGFLFGQLLENGTAAKPNPISALAWYRWAGGLGDQGAKDLALGMLKTIQKEDREASEKILKTLRETYGS